MIMMRMRICYRMRDFLQSIANLSSKCDMCPLGCIFVNLLGLDFSCEATFCFTVVCEQVKIAYMNFLNHCYIDTEVEMKEIYTSSHMWTLFEHFLIDMAMVFVIQCLTRVCSVVCKCDAVTWYLYWFMSICSSKRIKFYRNKNPWWFWRSHPFHICYFTLSLEA